MTSETEGGRVPPAPTIESEPASCAETAPAETAPEQGLATPRGMTVEALIDRLSRVPGDIEVVVNASGRDGVEVFALVKAVDHEPTCDGPMVCRIYADQEVDDAC